MTVAQTVSNSIFVRATHVLADVKGWPTKYVGQKGTHFALLFLDIDTFKKMLDMFILQYVDVQEMRGLLYSFLPSDLLK